MHWPERKTNYFGQRDYTHRENDQWEDNFSEVLNHLENFQKQGKIRHIGISNETPYGIRELIFLNNIQDIVVNLLWKQQVAIMKSLRNIILV